MAIQIPVANFMLSLILMILVAWFIDVPGEESIGDVLSGETMAFPSPRPHDIPETEIVRLTPLCRQSVNISLICQSR